MNELQRESQPGQEPAFLDCEKGMELEEENSGGEGGIRTPGTGFSPYNGLANRRIQPLCHLSARAGRP